MATTAAQGKRVFIHVGVPKSGTSFIQSTFRDNQQRLLEAGFLYPSRHKAEMFHAALDVNGNHEKWGLQRERVAGVWEQMAARVRDFDGTSVISSEFLGAAKRPRIRRALAHLEGVDVHVIATARDLTRQIPAEWQEGIKHGRTLSYAQFLERILDPGSHRHGRRFWNNQGLPRVLARWGAGLAADHVHVVTCPPAGSDPRVLWERFCSVIAMDPGLVVLPERAANTSLGVTEIEVLRRVNESVRHREDPQAYGRLTKILVGEVLRKHTSARVTTPAELVPGLQVRAKQWREQIDQRGYEVIGSMDDLEPTVPRGPFVDPDRVSPAAALSVTTAAVADLLREVDELRRREEQHRGRFQQLLRRAMRRVKRVRPGLSRVRRSVTR